MALVLFGGPAGAEPRRAPGRGGLSGAPPLPRARRPSLPGRRERLPHQQLMKSSSVVGGPPRREEERESVHLAPWQWQGNQPTRVRACAPVPAIDVAIIGAQKAPSEPTRAPLSLSPHIGIPSGSETRSKRPSKLRQRNKAATKTPRGSLTRSAPPPSLCPRLGAELSSTSRD